jgi:hypothetical protein
LNPSDSPLLYSIEFKALVFDENRSERNKQGGESNSSPLFLTRKFLHALDPIALALYSTTINPESQN